MGNKQGAASPTAATKATGPFPSCTRGRSFNWCSCAATSAEQKQVVRSKSWSTPVPQNDHSKGFLRLFDVLLVSSFNCCADRDCLALMLVCKRFKELLKFHNLFKE